MKDLFEVKDKDDKIFLNKVFIFSRVSIILMLLSTFIVEMPWTRNVFYNYDSKHYLNIATRGYKFNYEYAFFPMFPIICRFLLSIHNNLGMILIFNNAIAYLVGVGIYNMSRLFYSENEKVNRYSAVLWYMSPIAIYTAVPYTESLFCLLTIIVLYLYKTKKYFILNGVLLGLLVSTRSTGSLLFFTLFGLLFIDLIKSRKDINFKNKFTDILKMYIPATIISCLYPLYLQVTLGNWKYFVDVQYECWWKEKSNIISVLIKEFTLYSTPEFKNSLIQEKIEVILQSSFAFIVLCFCIYGIISIVKRKELFKKKELLIYLILTIYVCYSVAKTFTSPSTSYFRYLLACIPVYLIVDNEKVLRISTIIGTVMGLISSVSYFLFRFLY